MIPLRDDNPSLTVPVVTLVVAVCEKLDPPTVLHAEFNTPLAAFLNRKLKFPVVIA